MIANLLRALGDPPGLGLEAGIRYHLTTYGIWGFAMISSPTWRSAIDIGLRYLDLTFAFTRIQARDRRRGVPPGTGHTGYPDGAAAVRDRA